jgi:hypothetical protein
MITYNKHSKINMVKKSRYILGYFVIGRFHEFIFLLVEDFKCYKYFSWNQVELPEKKGDTVNVKG